MLRLLTLALLSLVVSVSLADDVKNAVNEVTTTKDGDTFCPIPIAGKKCPGSSIFHYYKCCGTANTDCCFNLQTWVIVVLAVLGVIFLASLVLSIIRCLCCRR